jgi:hypothetical protein
MMEKQAGPWEQEQYLSSWCAQREKGRDVLFTIFYLLDPSLLAFFGSDLDKKVEDSST